MKPIKSAPKGKRERHFFILRWTIISVLLISVIIYITHMPTRSYSGPLKPLTDNEKFLQNRLKDHITTLAGKIGERNVWHPDQLAAGADYIEKVLTGFGYGVMTQEFECKGISVRNLEAERPGDSTREEIVLIGAHYDSVMGSPGANDNASGVSALLEIARLLANKKPSRTVRFVAFVNEEPPFFQTDHMGSRVYALRSRKRGEKISAMISLETIGYYSDDPKSQKYPFPFSYFYPKTGNFIGFVGNMSSRKLVCQVIASFRRHTDFPSQGAAAPGWITGIGWSDHWSFWQEGYPAVMITDTALFRYQHYHGRKDTPDKINYDCMARVVSGLARVIADLAGISRDGPAGALFH
ncbi:MAG: M28 family peptidase [Deltaproteobacteria bacterium]|nr:M28 family peptidase [Deltaproteobacteria bacterium]